MVLILTPLILITGTVRVNTLQIQYILHYALFAFSTSNQKYVCEGRKYPHSTEIFRKYCKNIPWKYCKNAKIFRNPSLILYKYCDNLAMSAQNITYAIFSKYCQNLKMHKQYFFTFSSHVTKRKYFSRTSKKNSFLLINGHVL